MWSSPKIPGSSSTKTPYSFTPLTRPCTALPTSYLDAAWSHGSSVSCLRPTETRPLDSSTSSTCTRSFWLRVTIWPGCRTCCHAIWLTCRSASTPPRSRNAPNSVIDLTVPSTTSPGCQVRPLQPGWSPRSAMFFSSAARRCASLPRAHGASGAALPKAGCSVVLAARPAARGARQRALAARPAAPVAVAPVAVAPLRAARSARRARCARGARRARGGRRPRSRRRCARVPGSPGDRSCRPRPRSGRRRRSRARPR